MFIFFAACFTFLVVFVLIWPLRKLASLIKLAIVISVPLCVCAYLWMNGFLVIPAKVGEDNHVLQKEVARLKEKLLGEPANMTIILGLNELYLRLGHLQSSSNLLETALQKDPENSLLQLKLAETLLYSDEGNINKDIKVIFDNLKQSNDVETRTLSEFYLGLYQAQQGDLYGALEKWQQLIKQSHADDPWLRLIVPAVRKIAFDLNLDPSKEIPKPKPPRKVSS